MAEARAAVLVGPRQVEIQEFELPEIGDDDGLLRVEACGVCESDVPIFTGEAIQRWGMYRFPVILGHEIAGRIAAVGRNAAQRWGVGEGDRVVIERWIPCGHCDRCFSGDYRMCVQVVDGH